MSREEAAALYRRHIGTVYQLCLMLMKNVPDAEDASQTVFQRAMERTMEGLEGFADCLPGAKVREEIYGAGAYQKGDVLDTKAMAQAFESGRNI